MVTGYVFGETNPMYEKGVNNKSYQSEENLKTKFDAAMRSEGGGVLQNILANSHNTEGSYAVGSKD